MSAVFLFRTKLGFILEHLFEPAGKVNLFNKYPYFVTVDGSLSDTAVSSINDPYRGQNLGPGGLHKGPLGATTNQQGGPIGVGGGMGKKSNSTSQLSAAGNAQNPNTATQLAPPLDDLKPKDDMRDLPPSVPLQMLAGSDNQGTF